MASHKLPWSNQSIDQQQVHFFFLKKTCIFLKSTSICMYLATPKKIEKHWYHSSSSILQLSIPFLGGQKPSKNGPRFLQRHPEECDGVQHDAYEDREQKKVGDEHDLQGINNNCAAIDVRIFTTIIWERWWLEHGHLLWLYLVISGYFYGYIWVILTLIKIYLVGGDWNRGLLWLSIYWECHHSNWRSHIFQTIFKNHQPDNLLY